MALIPSHGDAQGVMLITISAIFEALALVAVALRIWSLRLKKRPFVANDWLIIFAMVVSTALVAIIIIAVVSGGLGQHTLDVITEPQKLIVFGKTFVAIQPIWVSAITSVKLSILDLYITIFRSPKFRKVCYAGMAVCAVFFAYDILAAFLICQPVGYNWNKTIPGGHCGNEVALYIVAHSVNFVIDVSLAILPMPILWKLQMPTRKKIEISILFSLGTLICVISVLRIAFWQRLKGDDLTYSVGLLYLFTVLEPLLGIVLASLPIMRPAGVQIINSTVFSWAKSLLASSGSGSGYQKEESLGSDPALKIAKARNFRRLHDDSFLCVPGKDSDSHPMASLEVHAGHVTPDESEDKTLRPDGISVTQAYGIHSSAV